MLAIIAAVGACTPQPRCTTLDTVGSFDGDTFRVPSCYFAMFEPAEMWRLLGDAMGRSSGTWVVMTGASNSFMTFLAWCEVTASEPPTP